MIRSITQKKSQEEIERLLQGLNRIFIIGCGTCVESCDQGALSLDHRGAVRDTDACKNCGRCAAVCPSGAREVAGRGINVNCVCPGPIHTGINASIPDDDKVVFANRRTALRRYGEPEEVAHAILGLVLPASGYTTGATLVVDGGGLAG